MTIDDVQNLYRAVPLPEHFGRRLEVVLEPIYAEFNVFADGAENDQRIRTRVREGLADLFRPGTLPQLMEEYAMRALLGLDLLDLLLPCTGWSMIEIRSLEHMRYWKDSNSLPSVIWGDFWYPRDARLISDRIAAELGVRFDASPRDHVIKEKFRDEFLVTGSFREYHGGVQLFLSRLQEG